RLPSDPAKRGSQLGNLRAGHKVGGKAAIVRVGRVQAGAGQTEVAPDMAGTAVEKARRPDIGEETNAGLRHRKKSVFGGDAIGAVDRNPAAAAHRDAVDDSDIGLWEAVNFPDQLVLF